MAKTRGDLLNTDKGKIIGKQQLYALLVDGAGAAVLDALGNEQLVEIQAGANGKIQTETSINGSLANIPVELQASKPESASAQDSQIATTEKEYTRAAGASQIEVYVESGYVRARTDGLPCTSTTGEPIASGFGSAWQVASISLFFVQESIVTVVSR